MRRFFTVLEGPGKGAEKLLDKSYVLVGRSHVADVQIEGDDLLISRRHLELRIADGEVFVKDISSKGSLLNGQRLKGEVSLNPGDVLELGQTKLQYQEVDGISVNSHDTASPHAAKPDLDRTQVADDRTRVAAASVFISARERAVADDATHMAGDDRTRMLNPAELPGWKSPIRQRSRSALPLVAGVLVLLLGAAGAYWYFGHTGATPSQEKVEFKDAALGFSVVFPSDWSRTTTRNGVAGFGVGKEDSGEWARTMIHADKHPQYSITGLRSGFADYGEVLKKQFKNVELTGSQRRTVSDIEVVFFGFKNPDLQGVGIFTLNADTRIVIECFSPRLHQQRFTSAFDSIFKSFRLTTGEPQRYIDFPLPDDAIKRLALASPAELSRQVDEHAKRAEALLASRDVRPDNLFRSVREYGHALQLAVAGPQPLPAYPSLAHGLRQATQAYNQAVDRQRFEINRALKAKDYSSAYWAATRLMQMVPEKTTPAYQEAYKVFRSLRAPK